MISKLFLQLLSNYWHYIIPTIILCCLINLVLNKKSKKNIIDKFLNDKIVENNYDDDQPALPNNLQHIPYVYVRPSENDLLRRAREFFKITNARRTIRFFSKDPVPKEIIQEIIRSAGE